MSASPEGDRSEGIARYVVVIGEGEGVFEYDIAEKPEGADPQKVAELLFSVALDMRGRALAR